MKREPAITIGVITAAIAAVIGLLVSFNLNVSDQQEAAILAVVVALAPLVSALLTRSKVTPVAAPSLTAAQAAEAVSRGAV